MKFEIVNHTYNYARLLAYQLSSLILHAPKGHQIVYSVFFDPKDRSTVDTLDFFSKHLPENIVCQMIEQEVGYLRSRHVGRNMAALKTEADWVWFADTDYLFGDYCWDDLAAAVTGTTADFVWPKSILQTTWPVGDSLIAAMDMPKVRDVVLGTASHTPMRRAIGGVQIASGSAVRQLGYCPSYRQTPSEGWNFRGDIGFRHQFPVRNGISLRNVVRIRHSQRGYGGEGSNEVRN